MVFSHSVIPDDCVVKVRDVNLSRVSTTKFLGILIDDKLKFGDHIVSVIKRVSKSIGTIYRLSAFIPNYSLKTLYYSLCYPHLIYGVTIWGRCAMTVRNRLDRLHRKAEKLVSSYNGSVKILSLNEIYVYFSMIKFYKCYNLPDKNYYFHNKIIPYIPSHSHSTRFISLSKINIPPYNKSMSQNFFLYQSVIIWNSLPESIKLCNSLNRFQRKLKLHLNPG